LNSYGPFCEWIPRSVNLRDHRQTEGSRRTLDLFNTLDDVPHHSRKVLAWRLSVTLETGPCLEALNEAMARYGKPEIMNTDRGSQFTSIDFTKALKDAEILIGMDGKGAWRDNVFVERLWRTIKYEEVYLRAYDSVTAARESLGRYLKFYNTRRPHSSLDGRTPDQAYLNTPRPIPAAA
jgi:putative transposase